MWAFPRRLENEEEVWFHAKRWEVRLPLGDHYSDLQTTVGLWECDFEWSTQYLPSFLLMNKMSTLPFLITVMTGKLLTCLCIPQCLTLGHSRAVSFRLDRISVCSNIPSTPLTDWLTGSCWCLRGISPRRADDETIILCYYDCSYISTGAIDLMTPAAMQSTNIGDREVGGARIYSASFCWWCCGGGCSTPSSLLKIGF